MKFIKPELGGRAATPRGTGFLALVLGLALLAGCAKPVYEEVSVALDDREESVIKDPSSLDAESLDAFERALDLMNDRNYEKAIALFEQVIEHSPGVMAPYVNVAMAYIKLDKLEPAEQHLKSALLQFPAHPVVSNEYGLLLRRSGRFTEAREIYEKTLKSFPKYLPVHRNLGILCDLYLNDQECALKQYEIYSEAMPEDEQVRIWIADLNLRIGR